MIQFNKLPPTTTKSKKRIGRGGGSGKGFHTATRGQKGQKSRSKIPSWFEGGQLPLIRRTPFLKGKGRLKPLSAKPIAITLTQLNKFPANAVVDAKSVIDVLKLNPKTILKQGIKIVATGKLEKSLKVSLPISGAAAKMVESQKGSVTTASKS